MAGTGACRLKRKMLASIDKVSTRFRSHEGHCFQAESQGAGRSQNWKDQRGHLGWVRY
jgi:hypothetical protein